MTGFSCILRHCQSISCNKACTGYTITHPRATLSLITIINTICDIFTVYQKHTNVQFFLLPATDTVPAA